MTFDRQQECVRNNSQRDSITAILNTQLLHRKIMLFATNGDPIIPISTSRTAFNKRQRQTPLKPFNNYVILVCSHGSSQLR